MSDISQLMFQVSLHHYLTGWASPAGALFRLSQVPSQSPSRNSHCLLAVSLAMPALASSSARSCLIIAHSVAVADGAVTDAASDTELIT